ncbi:flagellar biosynthetic protein FliS [Bryocella elongata]|uniref:Flagellar biosynthetic protein FliS n=1 Tax=Bryocella elongata TaxID=863522 RepID=A0A1H5TKY4_9BACT|nr:flagellar export chaperone FliS [Bryocella elongata]SEF63455.1 flagellar biosynthetic protein FliS [Bryocella elongata]
MNFSNPANSYRQSAIAGATPIGLVIALYDKLASDLRLAVEAMRQEDIEARCIALNHATLVLGQLQDWVNLESGDPLAMSLANFYQIIRARMLEASLKKSASLLEAQIELVLQVRGAWQQRDAASVEAAHGYLIASESTQPQSQSHHA